MTLELNGIITTPEQINANVDTTVKVKGTVSVGGTVIGGSMAQRGVKGDKGDTGDTGADGYSPTATVTKVDDTATISITDINGTTTAIVTDGQDGADGTNGTDGVGIVSVEKTSTAGLVDTYTITYDDGDTDTFDVTNGQDGTNGADGFSPIATVTKSDDTATISITDANGTTTATVTDGQDGTNGTNGQDGHSPVVTASKAGKVTTVSVDGSPIATINDGNDGVVADVTVNGTSVLDGATAKVLVPTKVSDLNNDSKFITGMTILSYGSSTWQDFLDAYNANKVVYCRASSNANPASGTQGRMAFMAYINFSSSTPTSVEFQYYRSVSSHSDSQQGDQVFIYKLSNDGSWSVTTREAYSKIATGTGLSKSYSSGTLTLNHSNSITAQTTQGLYPIEIDAQGHITAYGSAATIPTDTGDLTNGAGFITTETDPVFTTHVANGITSTDISNWDNGKLELDTSASTGTTDGDLYAAITALGWDSDVIE